MTIDYRHWISVLEVIVYSPCLLIALWMAFQHGFKKSSGWYFFNIFCLARLIGSACYLATIHHPSNINLYITWAVCTSIGISPLLLACIGLLSRANDSIMRKTADPLHPMIFRFIGMFSLVGVILSIVGTTQNSDITQGIVTIETKIGLIFYLITWVCLCGLFVVILKRTESIEDGEHRLLLAVAVSVPLILVRLVYSYIFAFGGNSDFSLLSGNVTIQLVMCVLEEILVVLVCLGIGLTLEVRPAAEYTQQLSVHSGEEELVDLENGRLQGQSRPTRRVQKPKRRGGPITKLVMHIVDEVKDRKR